MDNELILPADTNQARGIAEYAIEFLASDWNQVDASCRSRLELFHLDSVACAIAALGCDTNAPRILREEAWQYPMAKGARCFQSEQRCDVAQVVAANCSAVRELDANGTNFGYNPSTGDVCGEFGHNDFYPVVVAAAQRFAANGTRACLGMLGLDEIRGRLAEVFSLKTHRIDHVVHGGIAAAAIYGAMAGANVDQIESAIGMLVAHYIPFRAIRAGHQLSDSKGASAALTAEMAVRCVHRAIRGFQGPHNIFRNPQAIFRLFEPTGGDRSPFDLRLARRGDGFAIMGMHFKLGLYEHQSAGAIQGLIDILNANPDLIAGLANPTSNPRIKISIYQPAFGIIGDPAKRNPKSRQSADHSMVYIVARLLAKAIQQQASSWEALMLLPEDYDEQALVDPQTRRFMDRIEFEHRPAYDELYPDGIPTSLAISLTDQQYESGLVMYPLGHARHSGEGLEEVLHTKFQRLLVLGDVAPHQMHDRCGGLENQSAEELLNVYQL